MLDVRGFRYYVNFCANFILIKFCMDSDSVFSPSSAWLQPLRGLGEDILICFSKFCFFFKVREGFAPNSDRVLCFGNLCTNLFMGMGCLSRSRYDKYVFIAIVGCRFYDIFYQFYSLSWLCWSATNVRWLMAFRDRAIKRPADWLCEFFDSRHFGENCIYDYYPVSSLHIVTIESG